MPAGPPLGDVTSVVWALALTAAVLLTVAEFAIIVWAVFLQPVLLVIASWASAIASSLPT